MRLLAPRNWAILMNSQVRNFTLALGLLITSIATGHEGCVIGLNSNSSVLPLNVNTMFLSQLQMMRFNYSDPNLGYGNPVEFDQIYTSNSGMRWQHHPFLASTISIPLKTSYRQTKNYGDFTTGMGDINVQFEYFDKHFVKDSTLIGLFRSSVAFSLPTGNFKRKGPDRIQLPIALQPGTGSWSQSIAISYTLMGANSGFSSTINIMRFSTNKQFYQLGNQLFARISRLNKFEYDNSMLLIDGGFSLLMAGKDHQYGITLPNTSEVQCNASLKGVLSKGKYALQGELALPIFQTAKNVGGRLKYQASIGLTYLFGDS